MPYSFPYFKTEIKEWFKSNIPPTKRILDVGPGEGTYYHLLDNIGYRMDAVEIWAPYIEEYKLREKYDNVYTGNILDFDIKDYDFIILGDVLEHIPIHDAQKLISAMIASNKEFLTAIPYMMEQGEHNGNIFETHHQADLSPQVMSERYPDLKLIYSNEYYGYYIHLNIKHEKAFILYANASYHDTVSACVTSIKAVSDIPVIVYMINSHNKVKGAQTIYWECDIKEIKKQSFINRTDSEVYKLLIQRPVIIKDALEKYSNTVAYIDSDSVATSSINKMFDLYPKDLWHPYFVEGTYDWLQINGKGAVETREELYKSLEAPACKLFNIDQNNRHKYRQTGYFVAGQYTIDFLNEWIFMCNHPDIIKNPQYYTPYHEETIANILLWKYNIQEGLPYIYVNGSFDRIAAVYTGTTKYYASWVRIPEDIKNIFFFHGEKDPIIMNKMVNEIKKYNKLRMMFLAPHLSTGGMPEFLLQRIKSLMKYSFVEIFVVEYQCYSLDFIIQRDQIIKLVGKDNFVTLYEDKSMLNQYIKDFAPDIIHIDEMSERLDRLTMEQLYNPNRSYRIIETCHDVSFNAYKEKIFYPDSFAFCSPYHIKTFSSIPSPKEVLEFPINNKRVYVVDQHEAQKKLRLNESKSHVVNVGLWTRGKNQGEMLALAKDFPDVHFHFIGNQAGNFKDYWEPLMVDLPANVFVWGERNDAKLFIAAADVFMFNSINECNPLVLREAIGMGVNIITRNLPQYEDMFSNYIVELDSNKLHSQLQYMLDHKIYYSIPTNNTSRDFANNHINLYEKVLKFEPIKQDGIMKEYNDTYKITQNFINGAFIEITGNSFSDFRVEFWDGNTLVHNETIKINHWVKTSREYFTKWTIKVYKDGEDIYTSNFSLDKQRVYIAFDSSSLGDTLAWIPYLEEFRSLHNCEVIVSTFKNFLFEKSYPMIEFVKPGTTANNLYAMYKLGWFYDSNKEPVLPNTIPLQKTATNILGLKYKELIPDIDFIPKENPYKQKYVTIATNSTSGMKFWTKEGWQNTTDYLISKGYKVINTSKERNPFNGVDQINEDMRLDDVMNLIHHSEFFIGLSSGLAWTAFALHKKVIRISSFLDDDHEFTTNTIHVSNRTGCNGCWHTHILDKGNWNHCPHHENTLRMFECQTSITPKMVINEIKKLL